MTQSQLDKRNPESEDPGLSTRDLRDFFLQFSVMLSSGISLVDSLEVLSSTADQKISFVSARLSRTVASGHTLSGAMRLFPHSFDAVIVALVAVGEKTGSLDFILKSVAKRVDDRCKHRQRVILALTYPSVVILISLALIVLLSHYMLPVLLEFLNGLRVDIPWPTRVLLFFVKAKWLSAVFLGTLVFFFADLTWGLREETATIRNWVLFRSPGLGTINRQQIFLDFCRDLALMLEAGCLLTQALKSLSPACPDPEVSEVLLMIRQDLMNGESLESSLESYPIIPYVVSGSLAVGMETGQRGDLLRTVASLLEFDLETRIDRLTALIEPLTMAILGVIVGGILMASLLPIYAVITDGL